MAPDFLGTGWHFPPTLGADGEIDMVSDADDIAEAVRLIIQTERGERVMRPTYGCGLRSFVFAPLNTGTLAAVRQRVIDGLTQDEPRIDVDSVDVSPDSADPGRLAIEIRYRVRSTNTFYNLVFPFYLQEGGS